MTSTPEFLAIAAQGPLDGRGRLVHEDDGAAQLALALAHLEAALAEAGLAPTDLVALRVHTTDTAALTDVYDVLTERLDATGARPEITVTEVGRLAVPGMFVALGGLAARPRGTPASPASPVTPVTPAPEEEP